MTQWNQNRNSVLITAFLVAAFLPITENVSGQPFQATSGPPPTIANDSGGDEAMTARHLDYIRNYARFLEQVSMLRAALILAYEQDSERDDVSQLIARIKARGKPDLHDAWGTEVRIEMNPYYKSDAASEKTHLFVRSAGPNHQFDADDDLVIAFSISSRYYLRFVNQIARLGAALSQAYDKCIEGGDLTKIFAKMKESGARDVRDEWGTELHIEASPFSSHKGVICTYYVMRSAGPDWHFGTEDDLGTYIEARTGNLSDFGPLGNTIALKVDGGRGPANGLAEVVGTVEDVPDYVKSATVQAENVHSGGVLRTQTDAAGHFHLAGLPPGEYRIRVSSPGYWTLWREVTLKPRDRAVVVVAMLFGDPGDVMQITGPVLMDDDFVIDRLIPIQLLEPPPPPHPTMTGDTPTK